MHDQCAQSVALDTASFPDQSVVQYRRPDTLRHTARDAPVIRMDLLAGPTIAKEVQAARSPAVLRTNNKTRIPTLRIIGHYVPNFRQTRRVSRHAAASNFAAMSIATDLNSTIVL